MVSVNDTQISHNNKSKNKFICLFFLIFVALSFSWVLHVKPPFTSPDEGAHLSRADALRNGYIHLVSPDSKVNSGGNIDKSLDIFRSNYDKVIRAHDPSLPNELKNKMRSLNWSGENKFYSMANTAFYFPLVYSPQALGFSLGHLFNLNIFTTYKLVSALNLIAITLLLLFAWRFHPIPGPALVILLLPMSVFQFFSPTIDGLTFALAAFLMSLFCNLLKNEKYTHSYAKIILLCFTIFILSSSRANLLPLILFPLWLFINSKQRLYLYGFIVTSFLVLFWTYFSIKTVHDNGIHHPGIEQIDVLKHYIKHPLEVISIIWNTISDYGTVKSYVLSFIGVLGWLDAPLTDFAYWYFGLFIYAIFVVNIFSKNILQRKSESIPLVLFSLAVITLTFCALLVQWSTFPATRVDGVQGRYFIIPMIILGYAIMDKPELRKLSLILSAIMAVASVYSVHLALETRYF